MKLTDRNTNLIILGVVIGLVIIQSLTLAAVLSLRERVRDVQMPFTLHPIDVRHFNNN